MKRPMVAWLLKLVLVICAAGIVLAAGLLLPSYMRHVAQVKPELSGWYGWIVAFGWLLAIPALAATALLWQVFSTIGNNTSFCSANALRFTRVWILAVVDLVLVMSMGLFLWINQVTPPFLVLTCCGLLFLGAAACLTAVALSGLVRSAVALKEDHDMTI